MDWRVGARTLRFGRTPNHSLSGSRVLSPKRRRINVFIFYSFYSCSCLLLLLGLLSSPITWNKEVLLLVQCGQKLLLCPEVPIRSACYLGFWFWYWNVEYCFQYMLLVACFKILTVIAFYFANKIADASWSLQPILCFYFVTDMKTSFVLRCRLVVADTTIWGRGFSRGTARHRARGPNLSSLSEPCAFGPSNSPNNKSHACIASEWYEANRISNFKSFFTGFLLAGFNLNVDGSFGGGMKRICVEGFIRNLGYVWGYIINI